jgi:hypothetical protein
MKVQELLELIPSDLIEILEAETTVNHQVKKLHADVVFKLLLFSMIEYNKVSLRVMESFVSSAKFKHLSGTDNLITKYNSIRDRICTMDVDFFDKLFKQIFNIYNEYLDEKRALVKIDSTVVGISSKLVSWSLSSGGSKADKKHIKYSVALKGSLPCAVNIYDTKEMVSEDSALGLLMKHCNSLKSSIVVFDRGVQSRIVFDDLSSSEQFFVGRLRNNYAKTTNPEPNAIPLKPNASTVSIVEDTWCGLLTKAHKETKNRFRVIKAIIDSSKEEITFITNCTELNSYEIADLYKQRWEIEVFFKFIKQHLNVGHLVSRTTNGIKVMIYMTMIMSILITVYKKRNSISSYKIAKLKFSIELDSLLTKEIVILCGGDPSLAPHLFSDS